MYPFAADVEATFVPGDHGRDGAVALWGPSIDVDDKSTVPQPLVLADGPTTTPAHHLSIADAIAPLAELRATDAVSASVRAWGAALGLALDLVARGRLVPSISPVGIDTWRVGPLDATDREHIGQLIAALPPAAHAAPPPSAEHRLTEPALAVTAFLDAVADAMVRTTAAATDAGHDAFASPEPIDVSSHRTWLRSTAAEGTSTAMARLRVELPDKAKDSIAVVLEVQSTIDSSLVLPAAALWTASPAVQARFGTDVDVDLLRVLQTASKVWPPIERLLEAARPDRLELDDDEADALFGPVADDLAGAGLPVLWPRSVLKPLELRSVVTTPRPDAVGGAGLDLQSLGSLEWRAALDGDDLTPEELRQLAEAKRPLVRLRGQWVRADPTRLATLREKKQVRTGDVLAAALTGTLTIDDEVVEAELDQPLLDLAERIRHVDEHHDIEIPDDLDATLRPYQERGVAWLREMSTLGLGGVLADDMGLGKTIQILTLVLARVGRGPTLIVCPATLMGNWEREANRFAPGMSVRRHHGTRRSLDDPPTDGIVVTTYGVVRRDADELAAIGWDLVVADEAQAIKNPMSRTARAIRTIPANARIALTGTPVENRLSDLWALLDFTTPGLLGPLAAFQHNVAIPIEREGDVEVTERLAQVVKPFLLRRRKTDPDIAPDLPPKTETDRFVGLTSEQATLYKAVTSELLDNVEKAEGISRKGLVLKLLTALKQICNHPAQYLGEVAPIEGRSGKLAAADDLVQVIRAEGDAVLVFTQFVAMGHILTKHFTDAGHETQFLHGSVPVAKRQAMVDRFQAGEAPVFIISLQAGGTGLNLTAATHVIHFDRWWNPAVEDQASDRAWRIGQDRPVQVHRLICEGTLEERIAVMLDKKRALADSVVGGGEAWVSELTDADLADLVALGEVD